jgi:hypothetical protein
MSKREPSVWKLPGLASNCENVKGVGIVDAIYMYSELDTSILCTAVMKNHYEVLVRAKYESCFRSSFWSESHVTCHIKVTSQHGFKKREKLTYCIGFLRARIKKELSFLFSHDSKLKTSYQEGFSSFSLYWIMYFFDLHMR